MNLITVHKILETICDAIKSQPKVPLLNIVVIDGGRLLDLVEKMRSNLQDEVRQAKWMAKESQEILSKAKEKAEKIIIEAQDKANFMISENEISRESQIQSRDILRRSTEEEMNILKGADEYADEILSRTEDELNKCLIVIQKSRNILKENFNISSFQRNDFEKNKNNQEEKSNE